MNNVNLFAQQAQKSMTMAGKVLEHQSFTMKQLLYIIMSV